MYTHDTEELVVYQFRFTPDATLSQRMTACTIAGFKWHDSYASTARGIVVTDPDVANALRKLQYIRNVSNQPIID
jgi:hypothetical protein